MNQRQLISQFLRHAARPKTLPMVLWKNLKSTPRRRDDPYSLVNLGANLSTQGRYKDALACYDRALAVSPDLPEALGNKGRALFEIDRLDAAEENLRTALRLKPSLNNARNTLCSLLVAQERWNEAETLARETIELSPQSPIPHHLLARILVRLGKGDLAVSSFRRCVALAPDDAAFHEDLGLALLLVGKYAEGWREYEWRHKTAARRHDASRYVAAAWDGSPVGGRTILLHAEQGLGDTLQFCRYVPMVGKDARVILEVQPALVRLLKRMAGIEDLIPSGAPLPSHDLHCSLLSLPFATGTTLDTIPAAAPYLSSDPVDVAHWRERLAGVTGLRVGICWAGGQNRKNPRQVASDGRRSMHFERIAELGDVANVSLVSLQKGAPSAQAHPIATGNFYDFTDDIHDLADTAALMENLDLIVSVDTSVAHLAGALGKPVWLLNRFDTCFRWLREREDSPWYPTLRLFRQPSPGDWNSVMARAKEALQRASGGS